MRAARAAKILGVDVELLNGLIQSKAINGWSEPGRSGEVVYLIDDDEVDRLKALAGGG